MLGYQKNFSKFTVSGNYSASDTEITILGSNLVSLIPNSGSGIFSVVWYDHTNYPNVYNDPNKEICRVTGFSGQLLYLDRGRENTSPVIHSGSTYKMIATPTARGFNNLYYFRNPEKSYYLFEDFFLPTSLGTEGWSRAVSSQTQLGYGAGAYGKTMGGLLIPGDTGNSFRLSFLYGSEAFLFGSGLMVFEAMMFLGLVPSPTDFGGNEFNYWLGFGDNINNSLAVDGAQFVFTSGSSGFYMSRIASNSVRVDTITDTVITTGWHKYNIVINQDATVSDWYIDDVLIASITGNLPESAGRMFGVTWGYVRSAGNINSPRATGIIDYISVYKELQPIDSNYGATGYSFRI